MFREDIQIRLTRGNLRSICQCQLMFTLNGLQDGGAYRGEC